ncbi:DHH family phosphoesterase [Natronomonas amylolytica]|uniref:DHH family phosphoesterase n=1 Tax=Natronomonas amylolytica TaxID=3108498 RepID=UPI00300BE688
MHRLVLGCGSTGLPLVERLARRPEPLLVVLEDDERRARSLREEGIDARSLERTDPDGLRTVAGTVDSVVLAPDEADRLLPLARLASEAYPDAFLLACIDSGATAADRAAVSDLVDRTVDAADETSEYVVERAAKKGVRMRKLKRILRDIDGTLAVVAHDNPDPDAIASAVGLTRLAEATGTDATPCYYGNINHQENRALVNLLEYDLRNLTPETDLVEEFAGFALVDHSRPGINDGLPESTPVDIVIDHHPPRAPVEARFVDLRSSMGSTSTLIEGYFHQLGIEPPADIATGLLYGIQTDTDDFSREVVDHDFEAAARLVDRADSSALQRIESPSVTADTLETVAAAIANRRVEEDVLTTGVGPISDRDALAQAADKLLEMDGISTTLVFGYTEETVYASARSRGTDLDLGEALRDAFGQIGSAGGHAEMAGAQIPVGMLVEEDDEADRGEVIEEVITERFFETLGIELNRPATAVYADFLGTDDLGE